jgi:hypothetical protein
MSAEEIRHTVHSRSLLLGFVLGQISGSDATISGGGLDEWRSTGVAGVTNELRELHIQATLRPLRISNLNFNAAVIIQANAR